MCEVKQDGLHPYHRVNEKYARAVLEAMNAVPVLIPALTDANNELEMDVGALLENLHGLL